MLFPCFLLIFEVVFLVLFGLLVKYDELGQPVLRNSTEAAGQLSAPGVSIVSTYPRKLHLYQILHGISVLTSAII